MDKALLEIIENFDNVGTDFAVGNRNKIKVVPYNNILLNIKSFKVPNFLNGIVYKFFRDSKAKRSFKFAKILEEKQIGTPKPIAYYENFTWYRLNESYYISEHLKPDYVFRDVFYENLTDLDSILIQLGHFCFNLHEKGIEFLDHSPGNTLIKKNLDGVYDFFLVDLNRMKFHKKMSFKKRMKNLSRLTPSEYHIKFISKGYAKNYEKSEEEVFELLWEFTKKFQSKYLKKQSLKKKIKL